MCVKRLLIIDRPSKEDVFKLLGWGVNIVCIAAEMATLVESDDFFESVALAHSHPKLDLEKIGGKGLVWSSAWVSCDSIL